MKEAFKNVKEAKLAFEERRDSYTNRFVTGLRTRQVIDTTRSLSFALAAMYYGQLLQALDKACAHGISVVYLQCRENYEVVRCTVRLTILDSGEVVLSSEELEQDATSASE